MRCVFSHCLNDNSLDDLLPRASSGHPPAGPPGGVRAWRAVSCVLRSTGAAARAVADDLVTTFFPSDCRVCGGALHRAGLSPVCDFCLNRLHEQPMSLCVRCGEALDVDSARFASQFAEGRLCAPCRMAPPEFERAVAYGAYEDELRRMIHLLKYEGIRAVARPLGRRLAQAMAPLEREAARDLLVVPVPLFAAKQRRRGYNQAQLLADAAMAELRGTHPAWRLTAEYRALRRVRNTESQFGLTPRGRRRNLRGAFAAETEAIAGREVLLLDDIYTTGATARECSRVLRRAGAGKVWVATVARAQRETVALWSRASDEDAAQSSEHGSMRMEVQ